MFLKSIYTSSHVKDTNLINAMLLEVVEELGIKHIVQVIMDKAANYVVAGKMLCDKYPTIFWTLCDSHCIDLILEYIRKLEWVHAIVHECKQITKYIYNHAWVLSVMRECTEGELTRLIVTCFTTTFSHSKSF